MLYLVPTPIGNLEDITLRAIRILQESDLILAEDTRVTGKLLKHLQVDTPMKPFHQHNEHKQVQHIIERLLEGAQVAMVTDAGTPGISDPAFLLVRACREADIELESLPGPTAFVPALVDSGLPCDRFVFEGFLPQKKGRKTRLEKIALEERTTVIYESPHRMLRLCRELIEHCGPERMMSYSREISKRFHETFCGTTAEVAAHLEAQGVKGEFVVVIGGA